MLDVIQLPSLHEDLTAGSCSHLSASALLSSRSVGASRLLEDFHSNDPHSALLPSPHHGFRRSRAVASAFGDATHSESEEERREPAWPLMLVSYYKMKIKEMQDLALKYSLKKIEAERDAFRAHDAEEYANREAEQARREAEQVDNGPDDTVEALEEKIMYQEPKEEAVKDEVVASTNLLDADDRRDQAMKSQIDAMQKDVIYEQKLRAAMAEQKVRSQRRNLVPGVIAVDCSGRQIVTKESCDAESNTIFRDGECVVTGGDNPPQSPEELAAANNARLDEERIEKRELDSADAAKRTWGPIGDFRKARINLRASQADLARERARFSKDSKGAPLLFGKAPPAQQKQMDADQADIKKKEGEVAHLQQISDDAEAKEKAALAELEEKRRLEEEERDQHIRDLQRLLNEEDKVETDDVVHMDDEDKHIHDAKDSMSGAQKDLSDEETREAKILCEEADDLKEKAENAPDTQKADLLREAEKARLWCKEAEWEANASRKHDQEAVAEENVAQKNAYRAEREAERDAERDGYANGQAADNDPPNAEEQALDPHDPEYAMKKAMAHIEAARRGKRAKLTKGQADEAVKIRGTLKQEAVAEQSEIDSNNAKAAAEEDRNSTALREAETRHKLKEEMDHKNQKPTSSLSVDVVGWPLTDHKLQTIVRQVMPAKLAGPGILLKSELPASVALLMPVPRQKRVLKNFL